MTMLDRCDTLDGEGQERGEGVSTMRNPNIDENVVGQTVMVEFANGNVKGTITGYRDDKRVYFFAPEGSRPSDQTFVVGRTEIYIP